MNDSGWGVFVGYNKDLHFVKSEKLMATFIILLRNLTVVLGTNDLKDKAGMRYNVRKCKHSGYKEVTFGNDIMMLKVRTYTLPFILFVTCNINFQDHQK